MAQSKQPLRGRPLKFKSPEDLQRKIDAYFRKCDSHWITETFWYYPTIDTLIKNKVVAMPDYTQEAIKGKRKILTQAKPYLITGLAVELDTTRDTLIDYEYGNRDLKPGDPDYNPDIPAFSDAIKKAKVKIHNWTESALYTSNTTGAIFSLKNNYEWVDKTEVDEKSDQTVTVVTRGAGSSASDD